MHALLSAVIVAITMTSAAAQNNTPRDEPPPMAPAPSERSVPSTPPLNTMEDAEPSSDSRVRPRVRRETPIDRRGAIASGGSTFTECRQQMRQQSISGDQRRAFMRTCLRDTRRACAVQARQQQIAGEGRRDFMRSCMGRPARRNR